MKTFSAEQMRELDRRTIGEYGIPGILLMENAGDAIAREALRFSAGIQNPEFLILAGKGNNGGDAFVVSRLLLERNLPVTLLMAVRPDELSGDAAEAFEAIPQELKEKILFEFEKGIIRENTVIIDGLLGTGCRGVPKPPFDTWIRLVNDSGRPVIAIDIPSGLNANDGSAELCVTADLTVTMAGVKTGMLLSKGSNACGRIRVAEIGIPQEYLDEMQGGLSVFTMKDAAELLCRELFDTFKNRRGHLAVIGGSRYYPHAPLLSAEAALRTGAGLVTAALPASVRISSDPPKALILRFMEDSGLGFFNGKSLADLEELIEEKDALAAGPGLSVHPESLDVLELLLRSGIPLLLDADALNLLAKKPELAELKSAPLILTPHPGEMRRLQNAFDLDPDESRTEQALALASACGAVVLLKGCRTVIASPAGEYSINLSGCAALATAGSGDILTGIIAAFLAQGLEAWDAARLGAFLHGLCGETAAPFGSRGIIADDLPSLIPEAMRRILPVA